MKEEAILHTVTTKALEDKRKKIKNLEDIKIQRGERATGVTPR